MESLISSIVKKILNCRTPLSLIVVDSEQDILYIVQSVKNYIIIDQLTSFSDNSYQMENYSYLF